MMSRLQQYRESLQQGLIRPQSSILNPTTPLPETTTTTLENNNNNHEYERTKVDRTYSNATLSSISTAGAKSLSTIGEGGGGGGSYYEMANGIAGGDAAIRKEDGEDEDPAIVMPPKSITAPSSLPTNYEIPVPAAPDTSADIQEDEEKEEKNDTMQHPQPSWLATSNGRNNNNHNHSNNHETKSKNAAAVSSPPRYLMYRESLAEKVKSFFTTISPASSPKKESLPTVVVPPLNGLPSVSLSATATPATTPTKTSTTTASPPRYTTYRTNLAKSVTPTRTNNSSAGISEAVTPTTTNTITTSSTTILSSSSPKDKESEEEKKVKENIVKTKVVVETVDEDSSSGGGEESANAAKEKNSYATQQSRSHHVTTSPEDDKENDNLAGPAKTHDDDDDEEQGEENEEEDDNFNDDHLATRLSTFLAKAEKGKPPIPPHEMDMHTSWSDFDPVDLPDSASRGTPSVTELQRKAVEKEKVNAQQSSLIQKALAATDGLASSEQRHAVVQKDIQKERLKAYDEQAQKIVAEQRAEGAAAAAAATESGGDWLEEDIENGLIRQGGGDKTDSAQEMAKPRKCCMTKEQSRIFLVFCIIVAIVMVVLGILFR